MYSTNFGHLFHLLRSKVVLLAFALGAAGLAHGQLQYQDSYNFKEFSKKPYYFGITLGYNTSTYRVFLSEEFLTDNPGITSVEPLYGPGFNLGIVTNVKIGQFFDFRFLPTLSFAERSIQFNTGTLTEGISPVKSVESVFVELPFHMRYKSAPYKDVRLFLIGGVKYSFDVASDTRREEEPNFLKVAPSEFAVEYGAGIQIFFPFFIFSPEFKISQGLGNSGVYDATNSQTQIIDAIKSRTFTFSLHFEG